MQFSVVEQAFQDVRNQYEETYLQFKEVWINNPNISKKRCFEEIGMKYHSGRAIAKYVNKRLAEDGLLGNHFESYKGIYHRDEYEDVYQEYKDYFENTNLPVGDIYKKLKVSRGRNNGVYKYIRCRCREDGLDARKRWHKIKNEKDWRFE